MHALLPSFNLSDVLCTYILSSTHNEGSLSILTHIDISQKCLVLVEHSVKVDWGVVSFSSYHRYSYVHVIMFCVADGA